MNAAIGVGLVTILCLVVMVIITITIFAAPIVLLVSAANAHPRARFLGVCSRLAQMRRVPVAQVRLLAAVAIFLSGILPGLFVYLLLGIFMEQWAGRDAPGPSVSPPPLPPLPLGDFGPTVVRQPAAGGAAATGPTWIGRYRITGTLGHGGMGTVCRGRDEVLGRDVAIKVIQDRFGGVEHVVRRFEAEARAVAQISSPHIVHVYEFDPVAVPPYLVMELVGGPSLQQFVKRRGRGAFGTVAECARQTLRGLATAHAAGIIHRDVKPGNILRAADGTYKLTDFGLARSLEQGQSLTASGSVIGTLHYMAPEVAAGDEATAASDLYSLGATLYEMLAGRPPFAEESPLRLLRRIVTETPPPVAAHRDDVPPLFEAWLGKLLARDPGDRFSSAAAALDALAAIDVGPPAADDFSCEPCETTVAEAAAVPPHVGLGAGAGTDRWSDVNAAVRAWPQAAAPAPRRVAAGDVQSIIRRAMELEAAGRDLLGHDTVLDIARELNVDSMFVREALRRHRESLEMPVLPVLTAGTAAPRRKEKGCAPVGLVVIGAMAMLFMAMLFMAPSQTRTVRRDAAHREFPSPRATQLERDPIHFPVRVPPEGSPAHAPRR
jgi:serine/threonine-protein kinase